MSPQPTLYNPSCDGKRQAAGRDTKTPSSLFLHQFLTSSFILIQCVLNGFYICPAAAAASAAFFCCMAWCSANRSPTRCVILMYRPAQFSRHEVSDLSKVLERKVPTHPSKQRATKLLYMLKVDGVLSLADDWE